MKRPASKQANPGTVALVAAGEPTTEVHRSLARFDFDVRHVHPKSALAALRSAPPDVVLLHADHADLGIAELSGVAPVILYGGRPEVADVSAWMRAGAADYLAAGTGPHHLRQRLRHVLSRRDT